MRVANVKSAPLVRPERDAPGQFTNLDGLDDAQGGDINNRDIVGNAISDDKILFVRRKRAVPDTLPDQKIFQNGVSGAVDDRHAVGGPEIDEAELAVFGDVDPDR